MSGFVALWRVLLSLHNYAKIEKNALNYKPNCYNKGGAMETLEKALQNTNDISRQIQHLKELKQQIEGEEKVFAREPLEQSYQNESLTAEASDSKTHIQCVVDRIVEFTESRKFYQLGEAIDDAVNQIKIHKKNFPGEKLGEKVFAPIINGLNVKRQSLQTIKDAITKLKNTVSISNKSTWCQLRTWAENLELLGEELEDNLEIFPSEFFDILEKFCETIVLKTRKKAVDKKDRNQNRKEEWRRRVRYAAGFILNLIETAREEAIQEDEEVVRNFFAMSQPFDNTWED